MAYLGGVCGVVYIKTILIRDIVNVYLILPVLDVVDVAPEAFETVFKDGAKETFVVVITLSGRWGPATICTISCVQ